MFKTYTHTHTLKQNRQEIENIQDKYTNLAGKVIPCFFVRNHLECMDHRQRYHFERLTDKDCMWLLM